MKISIDTRTIKKGECFVPIKGPNFDGNLFVKDAIKKGAKGIINENEFYKIVKDKLKRIKPIIIGVAGSIGKSTFRSYLHSILKTKYDVLESDQNTKLGFSLKVVNELNKQKIIVAEIGIDRIGEMEKTASFIKPDLAIITKLGKEHLQFFKTFKNVIREESMIFNYAKIKNFYINSIDLYYYKKTDLNQKYLEFFDLHLANANVENKISDLLLPSHEKDYLRGVYRIAKKYFKMSDNDFILGLRKLIKPKGRFNLIELSNNSIVIDDTYNAVCDETIIKGIEFTQNLAINTNRILKIVISNMVENGASSDQQHKNICKFINKSGLKEIYIAGNNLKYYKKYLRIKHYDYPTADKIKFKKEGNMLYYIKATRKYLGPELVEKIKKIYD